MGLDLFVVYSSPKDYPGEYVIRRFEVIGGEAQAHEIVARGRTLAAVRRRLPPWLSRFARSPQDDLAIVEVWL